MPDKAELPTEKLNITGIAGAGAKMHFSQLPEWKVFVLAFLALRDAAERHPSSRPGHCFEIDGYFVVRDREEEEEGG